MGKTEANKIIEPFFSHDKAARGDEKIVRMFYEARKQYGNLSEAALKDALAWAYYGLYWGVVEYMHRNNLKASELEMLAYELRIDPEILSDLMNNYQLFREENGCYVSDRILRNLEYQAEKSEQNSKAAKARWALAYFKKICLEVFEKELKLNKSEVPIYLDYDETIDGFREKLPDILYTLKTLRFENNPKFVPTINWLLESNNLVKLLNGGYGKLKSWKEHKDYLKAKEEEENVNAVSSVEEAIELLLENTTYIAASDQCVVNPSYSVLFDKFNISRSEIRRMKLERLKANA